MFRQKEESALRARLNTTRISVTEIALEGRLHLLVEEDGAEGTRDDALLAGDTFFSIDVVDPILCHNRSGRTVLHAFGHLALSANNGHPDDRMGVDDHHPNGALLWIVYSEAMDGAYQLAQLASGASFRNDRQFPRHDFLLTERLRFDYPLSGYTGCDELNEIPITRSQILNNLQITNIEITQVNREVWSLRI